jgi:hypothetical protein
VEGLAGEPLDPYAAIVAPHCVHDPDGIPPGIPAWVQSVARLVLRIPLQGPVAAKSIFPETNTPTATKSERIIILLSLDMVILFMVNFYPFLPLSHGLCLLL